MRSQKLRMDMGPARGCDGIRREEIRICCEAPPTILFSFSAGFLMQGSFLMRSSKGIRSADKSRVSFKAYLGTRMSNSLALAVTIGPRCSAVAVYMRSDVWEIFLTCKAVKNRLLVELPCQANQGLITPEMLGGSLSHGSAPVPV